MFGLLGTIDTAEIFHQAIIPTEILWSANFEQANSAKLQLEPLKSRFTSVVTAVSNPQKITADNQNFNYSGRIDWHNLQAPAFGYPGTAVKFKFTGTSLKIELSEDNWGDANFVDVYLDDNPQPITIELKRQSLNGQPVIYNVAEGLENKVHNAVLIKRNDYVTGEFNFHGIIIDGEILAAEPDSQRTIEVYGDSVSSGIAVEYEGTGVKDPEGDNNHLDNAYYSYGSMLARHYNAELSIVAQAGVPLVNGYGYWNKFWRNGVGAEAIYDKVKPLPDAPTWNFNNYTPDLVIIAYGQNDSGTIEIDKDMSSQEWKERYKQLLANLRSRYPNAYFIGMIPNMFHDSQWDAYVKEAIAEYSAEENDQRVFSLIHKQVTPGHPRISEQKLMADTLIKFIDQTLTKHGFSW